MPPQIWRGIWHGHPDGGRMVARPHVARKFPDGSVTTHFGISVRTAYLTPPLALIATERSVIRYRLKQDHPGSLQPMLLTSTVRGGYGGNFECRVGADELKPRPEGWCETAIPISRFQVVDQRPQMRQSHPTLVGNLLTSVLLPSYTRDTKLTVASFELATTP